MGYYRFRVMPPGEPYYETEGSGINWGVAKTNVARREGVNEGNVCYLGDVKSSESSSNYSSSDGDVGGYLILGAIIVGIWLLVEYWWIVVPAAVILGLLAWYGSTD